MTNPLTGTMMIARPYEVVIYVPTGLEVVNDFCQPTSNPPLVRLQCFFLIIHTDPTIGTSPSALHCPPPQAPFRGDIFRPRPPRREGGHIWYAGNVSLYYMYWPHHPAPAVGKNGGHLFRLELPHRHMPSALLARRRFSHLLSAVCSTLSPCCVISSSSVHVWIDICSVCHS